MTRAARQQKLSAAEKREKRERARYEAVRLLIDRGDLGLAPNTHEGRDVGMMVGLQVDGLALARAERDRVGDLVFDITEAGREAFAKANGKGRL